MAVEFAGRDGYPKMMDNLFSALTSIKVLRCTVCQIFSSLSNGIRDDHYSNEENKEAKFLSEIDDLLVLISHQLRYVEKLKI